MRYATGTLRSPSQLSKRLPSNLASRLKSLTDSMASSAAPSCRMRCGVAGAITSLLRAGGPWTHASLVLAESQGRGKGPTYFCKSHLSRIGPQAGNQSAFCGWKGESNTLRRHWGFISMQGHRGSDRAAVGFLAPIALWIVAQRWTSLPYFPWGSVSLGGPRDGIAGCSDSSVLPIGVRRAGVRSGRSRNSRLLSYC